MSALKVGGKGKAIKGLSNWYTGKRENKWVHCFILEKVQGNHIHKNQEKFTKVLRNSLNCASLFHIISSIINATNSPRKG